MDWEPDYNYETLKTSYSDEEYRAREEKNNAEMIALIADFFYGKTGNEWYKRVADGARELAKGE